MHGQVRPTHVSCAPKAPRVSRVCALGHVKALALPEVGAPEVRHIRRRSGGEGATTWPAKGYNERSRTSCATREKRARHAAAGTRSAPLASRQDAPMQPFHDLLLATLDFSNPICTGGLHPRVLPPSARGSYSPATPCLDPDKFDGVARPTQLTPDTLCRRPGARDCKSGSAGNLPTAAGIESGASLTRPGINPHR